MIRTNGTTISRTVRRPGFFYVGHCRGAALTTRTGYRKMVRTDCVRSGGQWPPCRLATCVVLILWRKAFRFVIARALRARGNLAVPGWMTGRFRRIR